MKYFKDLLLGLAIALLILFFNSIDSKAAIDFANPTVYCYYDGYYHFLYLEPTDKVCMYFNNGTWYLANFSDVDVVDNQRYQREDTIPDHFSYQSQLHPNGTRNLGFRSSVEFFSCAIPRFSSYSNAVNYYNNGVIDSGDYFPTYTPTINDLAAPFGDLPTPVMRWDKGALSFQNSLDDVYVICYSRFRSIDDIEISKNNTWLNSMSSYSWEWDFNAHSVINGTLYTLISSSDSFDSSLVCNFTINPNATEAFNTFISENPVDTRNIYGGYTESGSSFSGRDAYVAKLHSVLGFPGGYNQPEFFARYYKIVDDVVYYSPWGHLVATIPNATILVDDLISDTDERFYNNYGVGVDPIPTIDNLVNGVIDNIRDNMVFPNMNIGSGSNSDIVNPPISDIGNGTDYDLNFKPSWTTYLQLKSMFGVFPQLVRDVFIWMPEWLLNLICLSITLMVALGVYHAIRG